MFGRSSLSCAMAVCRLIPATPAKANGKMFLLFIVLEGYLFLQS